MAGVPQGFEFSSETGRTDRAQVHTWLSEQAYWALGRSRATQDAAIDGSRNFGVFRSTGEQVAYARVVTDGVTFAWVCDVFVDEAVRGTGVGVALMQHLCAELETLGIRRTLLKTGDAHGLYRKFGFDSVPDPELWMIKVADG